MPAANVIVFPFAMAKGILLRESIFSPNPMRGGAYS